MATQQHQELGAYQPDGAMVPGSQFISAFHAGTRYEHSDSVPEEWQERFRNLQQWVCELLIKNQQLRMLLELARAEEGASQGSRVL